MPIKRRCCIEQTTNRFISCDRLQLLTGSDDEDDRRCTLLLLLLLLLPMLIVLAKWQQLQSSVAYK